MRASLKHAALWLIPTAGLFIAGNAFACSERENILYTPSRFTADKEYAGRIAFQLNGENSSKIRIIDECAMLPRSNNGKLHFIISGWSEPDPATNEKYTYVLVQIIRFQKKEQASRLTISRQVNWKRGDATLEVLDDDELQRVSVQEFFDIHRAMTMKRPGDEKIQVDGVLWHGTPIEGAHSSLAAGYEIADGRIAELLKDTKTKLSSRLYRFQLGTNGKTGIPFYTKIDGTNRLIIHTYSPHRSAFDHWIDIEIMH